MSKLKSDITDAMKQAMKAQEKQRLGTIRMLLAAIKQREIDDQITLDDKQIISTITKMVKQRQEAIKQYLDADRTELADQEKLEIDILTTFLPEQLSSTEIESMIASAITETAAQDMKDMGKVMAALKPKLEGRADMSQVSALIKSKLA